MASYASVVAIKTEMTEVDSNTVPPGWIKLYKHPVNSRLCVQHGPSTAPTNVYRPNSLLKRFVVEERHREDMNRRYGDVSPYFGVRSYLDDLTVSESESEEDFEPDEPDEEFDEFYDQ